MVFNKFFRRLKIIFLLIKILFVKLLNYVVIISYVLEIINIGIYKNLGKF